ncbi:MAG: hypothetical protein OHK0038_04530 [Flammeovirgaceae bacterium]
MQEIQEPRPTNSSLERLIDNFSKMVETYFKLIQLELKSGVSDALTLLIVIIVVAVLGTFALLMFSIAISILISDLIGGSNAWGFLIVAALYTVGFIIMVQKREKIREIVQESVESIAEQK